MDKEWHTQNERNNSNGGMYPDEYFPLTALLSSGVKTTELRNLPFMSLVKREPTDKSPITFTDMTSSHDMFVGYEKEQCQTHPKYEKQRFRDVVAGCRYHKDEKDVLFLRKVKRSTIPDPQAFASEWLLEKEIGVTPKMTSTSTAAAASAPVSVKVAASASLSSVAIVPTSAAAFNAATAAHRLLTAIIDPSLVPAAAAAAATSTNVIVGATFIHIDAPPVIPQLHRALFSKSNAKADPAAAAVVPAPGNSANSGNGRTQSYASGDRKQERNWSNEEELEIKARQGLHAPRCHKRNGEGKKEHKDCNFCNLKKLARAWYDIVRCCGTAKAGPLQNVLSLYQYRINNGEMYSKSVDFEAAMKKRIGSRIFSLQCPIFPASAVRYDCPATSERSQSSSLSGNFRVSADVRETKDWYFIDGKTHDNRDKYICFRCMYHMEGFSNGTYFDWKKDLQRGEDKVSRRRTTPSSCFYAHDMVVHLLLKHADLSGQDDPLINGKKALPEYTVQELHTNLRKSISDEGDQPLFSISSVRRALADEMVSKRVSLRHSKGMAGCRVCDRLKAEKRKLKTAYEQEIKQKELDEHLNRQMTERKFYWSNNADSHRRQGVLSIAMDGMDKKKTQLPSRREPNKTLEAAEKLSIHVLGVLSFGCDISARVQLFLCLPTMLSDASLSVVVLMNALRNIAASNPKEGLPHTLLLQLDNSGRDNKNQYMLRFLGCLLSRGVFREIRVGFEIVGHTHDRIDQVFSRISHYVASHDVPHLAAMIVSYMKAYTSRQQDDIKEEDNNITSVQDIGSSSLSSAPAVQHVPLVTQEMVRNSAAGGVTAAEVRVAGAAAALLVGASACAAADSAASCPAAANEGSGGSNSSDPDPSCSSFGRTRPKHMHALALQALQQLQAAGPQVHVIKESYNIKDWLPLLPRPISGMARPHQFRLMIATNDRGYNEYTKATINKGDVICEVKEFSDSPGGWQDPIVLIKKQDRDIWSALHQEPHIVPAWPLSDGLYQTLEDCAKDGLLDEAEVAEFKTLLDEHKETINQQCQVCRDLQTQDRAIHVPGKNEQSEEANRIRNEARKLTEETRTKLRGHIESAEEAHPRAEGWFWGGIKAFGIDLPSPEEKAQVDAMLSAEADDQQQMAPSQTVPHQPLWTQGTANKAAARVYDQRQFDRSQAISVGMFVTIGVHWSENPCDMFWLGTVLSVNGDEGGESECSVTVHLWEHLQSGSALNDKNKLADKTKIQLLRKYEEYEKLQQASSSSSSSSSSASTSSSSAEDMAAREHEHVQPRGVCVIPFRAAKGMDHCRRVYIANVERSKEKEARQFSKSSLLAWMTKDKAIQRVATKVKDTYRQTSQFLSYTELAFKTELMAGFSEITERFPALVRELVEASKKQPAKGRRKGSAK